MTLRCRCEAHSKRASLTKDQGFYSWTGKMIDHDYLCFFYLLALVAITRN